MIALSRIVALRGSNCDGRVVIGPFTLFPPWNVRLLGLGIIRVVARLLKRETAARGSRVQGPGLRARQNGKHGIHFFTLALDSQPLTLWPSALDPLALDRLTLDPRLSVELR